MISYPKAARSYIVPAVVVAVWACFYVPRIFTLGFDADDWLFLVHWFNLPITDRFQRMTEIMPARPVMVVLLSFLPPLIHQSPHVAQALSAFACLVIALLIYQIALKISRLDEWKAQVSAALAAVTWLLIPWSLGYAAWAILVVGLIAAIFFLASFLIALGRTSNRAYFAAALLQVCSYLNYETFMFQFVVILVVKYFHERSDHPNWRFMIRPFLWFAGAQFLALLINRLAVYFNQIGSKPLHLDISSIAHNVATLPSVLGDKMATMSSAFLVVSWAVAIAALWVAGLVKAKSVRAEHLTVICTLLVFVIFSIALYNIGGYAVSFERRSSRIFLGINVLLVLILYLMADRTAATMSRRGAVQVALICLFFAIPILSFPAGMWKEQSRWADGWASAKEVIASAPVKELTGLPIGTAVIYNGPTNSAGFTYMGNIELTSGVFWKYPETGTPVLTGEGHKEIPRQAADNLGWYLPDSGVLPTQFYTTGEGVGYQWDGQEIVYEMAGHWTQKAKADRMLLWDHASGTVRPLAPCDAVYPAGASPSAFKAVGAACIPGW